MNAGALVRSLVLVAVGAIAVTALARAQADDGDKLRGQRILAQNCAACHAIGPTGDSPVAAAPPLRVLGQRYPLESLEEALGEGILVGHDGLPQMPEFVFSPEDIGDILAYLATVQTQEGGG
ncbi:c-type cytochrome [Salinarimonas sp.]|uniref:c-type cytochrome n=1 Tax=Salinarimonas sp. TaxID=2766526 RepID=UPI00391CBA9F